MKDPKYDEIVVAASLRANPGFRLRECRCAGCGIKCYVSSDSWPILDDGATVMCTQCLGAVMLLQSIVGTPVDIAGVGPGGKPEPLADTIDRADKMREN